MREIRLHDTRSGEVQPLRPRDPGRVGIYACGPTVYSRIHIGNARPYVVFCLLKRFLEHEGYESTLVVNITDVNDKIYDAARAQGGPSDELAQEMTEHYFADTERARARSPGSRAAGIGDDRCDHRLHRGADRRRARLRGGRRRVFPRALRPRLRLAVAPTRRRHGPGRGRGRAPMRKEDPLDFALWKAHKPGEDTLMGLALGCGAAGLAHRVLGDGRGLLGAGFDIHGGGSDLVFPHHENEAAQTRSARGGSSRGSGCTTAWSSSPARRWPSRSATSRRCTRCSTRYGRDAVVLYLAAATTASRWSSAQAQLAQAPGAASRASATPPVAWLPATRPPDMAAPSRERFFERWRTTSTRRRRSRPVRLGARGQSRATEPTWATATCARCCRLLGLARPARSRRAGDARRRSLRRMRRGRREQRARDHATSPRPTVCVSRSRARLGRPRRCRRLRAVAASRS